MPRLCLGLFGGRAWLLMSYHRRPTRLLDMRGRLLWLKAPCCQAIPRFIGGIAKLHRGEDAARGVGWVAPACGMHPDKQ